MMRIICRLSLYPIVVLVMFITLSGIDFIMSAASWSEILLFYLLFSSSNSDKIAKLQVSLQTFR